MGGGRRWRWRYQRRCDYVKHNCLCCFACLGSGLAWQVEGDEGKDDGGERDWDWGWGYFPALTRRTGSKDQTRTYLNRKKNKNKNKNIVLCSCALIFTVPGAMGINKMNNNRCNYTHLKPSIHSWTSISNHVNISFNSYTHEHQQQHQVNNNIKSR